MARYSAHGWSNVTISGVVGSSSRTVVIALAAICSRWSSVSASTRPWLMRDDDLPEMDLAAVALHDASSRGRA